jgi:hypothetical protein
MHAEASARHREDTPLADRVLPPGNAKAALLGVAPVVIAENMKDGQEPDVATLLNASLVANLPWRTNWPFIGGIPV